MSIIMNIALIIMGFMLGMLIAEITQWGGVCRWQRIIKMIKNQRKEVTVVTKANISKLADGMFS